MQAKRLLVIDDEPGVCYSFRRVFGGEGVEVATANSAAEGLDQARDFQPDVIVLDLQLPDRNGLDVFRELQQLDPHRPVVFITAHGTTETALEAMKNGAFDYLVKPVNLEQTSQVLARAFDAARLPRQAAPEPDAGDGERIVGRSLVMQEMCKALGRIAPQDVNVLIRGESGTGKELVARAIVRHSPRSDRPFLAINCAAIPESLLESELFGHEPGAFTGADKRRLGKFEQCDGGTLFLDEIGDLALPAQAKLLRVLQEQRFERVGGNQMVQTRVRILAATNQDLEQLVATGRFRKDLYYRLNVVSIHVPALRERREDIAELAHYFLQRFNRELGLDLRGLTPETLELLQRHDWPGNVRELEGVLKQAMLAAAGPLLLPEFLPRDLRGVPSPSLPTSDATLDLASLITGLLQSGEREVYTRVIQAVERELFTRVLRHTHGRQTQASEILGLNRTTLRYKLRELGVSVDDLLSE
jgi:two-component system nitrogen regulation response regulator GlnG